MTASTVRLSATTGEPLNDERVRETVVAAAHAIAERTGVPLESVETDANSVTVKIGADKLAAMGFGAELRRATNTWHEGRFGATLWGKPERDDGEAWR